MTKLEFTSQYNELYNMMYAFALRLTKDSGHANDLVQEASYKAYRARNNFREGTNFKAWLSTILRNTFINNYRKRKVRRVVNAPVETVTYQIDQYFQAANQGESNLRMQELSRLFQKLDDKYSIPFMMAFQGYMYDEIAATLDVPTGTVKSRIHTARVKLREMLKR